MSDSEQGHWCEKAINHFSLFKLIEIYKLDYLMMDMCHNNCTHCWYHLGSKSKRIKQTCAYWTEISIYEN